MMKRINMAEARAKFPALVKKVLEGETVVIGRYGAPVAVMLSYEKFLEMEEDLEDLRSALEAVMEQKRTKKRGRTLQEVLSDKEVATQL